MYYLDIHWNIGIQKVGIGDAFYDTYNYDLTFIHPFKFEGNKKDANWNIFKNVVIRHGADFKDFCYILNKGPGLSAESIN